MSEPLNTKKFYRHVERVDWPDDLPGPDFWEPGFSLEHLYPEEIKEKIDRVAESGARFYQKVKNLQAPMIRGDKNDPDAIHALEFALDRQDELSEAVKPSKYYEADPIRLWLLERQYFLVGPMQAVVIAEEGEMYDVPSRNSWEGQSKDNPWGQLEHLRVIFRNVMARIDIVATGRWDDEAIQPTYEEAVIQAGVGNGIYFPPAPPTSFWKIDDSLMENSTPKMHEVASALYHQGRVMGAGSKNLPVTKQDPFPPVFDVTIRAMELTIRSIDLMWLERPKNLAQAARKKLHTWLRERKNAAAGFRFAFLEFHIPLELYEQNVKINNSGKLFVLKNGEYSEWGTMHLL